MAGSGGGVFSAVVLSCYRARGCGRARTRARALSCHRAFARAVVVIRGIPLIVAGRARGSGRRDAGTRDACATPCHNN